MPPLPQTATAPFCPSETQGTIAFNTNQSFWNKLYQFMGPGFLIAIGYMDPGNWATDIEAGSRFGDDLLFVVLFSSLAAIVLQLLSLRLGIVTGRDLAQLSSSRAGPKSRLFLWLTAELSIVACDFAEVLGGALAFHLLLGVPILAGVVLTIFDTLIVLGLKGRNFRTLEAIILGLMATIGICYIAELCLVAPNWLEITAGFIPSFGKFDQPHALPLIVGIVGATIMPHNLYLHSSLVQTRLISNDSKSKKEALRLSTIDTLVSLSMALLINCAILVLSSSAFHNQGHIVAEIEDAYNLLTPLVGSILAAPLFAIALLASGQSSTFTGTVAGQVILDGFMNLKIPCWQRRIITRGLALIPALVGIWLMGDKGIGKMLVISQIVLGLQLPFALYPLIRQVSDPHLMGEFKISWPTSCGAWLIFAFIVSGNIWLLFNML